MNKVTKAELAKQFGVNQSRINALLSTSKTGKPPKLIETEDGFIDLDDPYNQAYLAERKITVPKYTGNSEEIEAVDEVITIEDEQLLSIENGQELDFSKIRSKKAAELCLSLIKVSKAQKENQLLEIELQEKLKKVIDTEVLTQLLMRSYGFLLENLKSKPMKIIGKLRQIILSGENTNNEDVKFLIDEYSSICQDALKETKKAMIDFYGKESETGTS